MTERFDKAFKFLMDNEGGYANNKNDLGGETKYGISKRSYPNVDIKNLTLDVAKLIYKRDFWDIAFFDKFAKEKLAIKVFDIGVNTGIRTVIKLLQNSIVALGGAIKVDGIIGQETLKYISLMDEEKLLSCFENNVISHYASLIRKNPKLKIFENNWMMRAKRKV